MNITAIPREDMNSVSTRVHYYYYLNNLPEGFSWKKHKGEYGDVLYVQKKADEKTIKIAKKAKKLGVPVVYDCDDNPYRKPGKDRVKMLRLADAVTTDTEGRAAQLKKAAGITTVHIIPECVDYCDRLRSVPIRDEMKTLITFGNNSNAVHAAKYMVYSSLECRHINSKPIGSAGKFVKWKLKTFVDEMCKADVCLLAHNDNLKSDLKVLVCFALGIPVIVSATKYYSELMESVGLTRLIATSPSMLRKIETAIAPVEERRRIVEAYGLYEMRTPEKSGEALAKVFESVCSKSV